MIDLYAVLGVTRNASTKVIQKAYRRLARQFHPDRNLGDDAAVIRFQNVQQAWDILGDDERRKRYDVTGECDLRADNAMVPIVAMLSAAMAAVLNELLEKGRDPRREDMVAEMKKALANRREDVKKKQLDFQKGKTAIAQVVERFTVEEGENELASIARAHLTQAETQLRSIETELGHTDAAIAFLKRFAFKRDGKQDMFAIQGMFATVKLGAYK